MRRVLFSALLAGGLLVACSDQPTEVSPPVAVTPPMSAIVGVGCPTVPTAGQLLVQLNLILPNSPIRTVVIALVNGLPSRIQDRIKASVRNQIFVIQDLVLRAFNAGQLKGGKTSTTFDNVLEFIRLLYCYVGLTPPNFPTTTVGADVGVGVVFPNSPKTTISAPSLHGAVTIPQGAAPAPTTIVVRLLPDTPGPLLTSLNQYPLFYEFTGTTATGPVVFNLDVTAGVCLRDITSVPDANLRLAHNVGTNFGDVEVLPRPATVPGLNCSDLGVIGFGAARIGRDFAASARRWQSVERALAPVARALLPEPLHASTVALQTVAVGGTTKKFSPFGVVDIFSNPGLFTPVGPTETSENAGTTVTRAVHVMSKDSAPIAKVPVTFSPGEGSGTVAGSQPVLTDASGNASVSWTLPEGAGVYTLTATVPTIDNVPTGIAPPGGNVTFKPDVRFDPSSLTFTVAGADDGLLTPLPCSFEGSIRSLNSNQQVTVTFTNSSSQSLSVFWLDFNGHRDYPFVHDSIGTPYAVLAGQGNEGQHSYDQITFVTHPWLLIGDAGTEGEHCYGIYLPLSSGGTAAVSDPSY